MSDWSRRIPFKVDVAGVIHVMGAALYARPAAAVRELIQNAHDAMHRRSQTDVKYLGRLDIRQRIDEDGSRILEFEDNGFGLSVEEAEKYLGTLGVGVTGWLKGSFRTSPTAASSNAEADDLIGMFGIGLFSGFMLADKIVVESLRVDATQAVRWEAGQDPEILLGSAVRRSVGTIVRLYLKPEHAQFAESEELLEKTIRDYADYVPFPIHLNDGAQRVNVIQSAWLEATQDEEEIELAFTEQFDESPLGVLPVQISKPPIVGALYISPQRTPGFSDEASVTATIRRMVISRSVQGLLPQWATFLRGVLELRACMPTASREELVRNETFFACADALEETVLAYFEGLAKKDPSKLQSILNWHRYTLAGTALVHERVRELLKANYRFATSDGQMTFEQIVACSDANPIFETEFETVIWYNTDRRQEAWMNSLFGSVEFPCVHTIRSFEESLLAAMIGSADTVGMRLANPASEGFAEQVLGMDDVEEAPAAWQEFLGDLNADILLASFAENTPTMAFLNEKHELMQTFEELKKTGALPAGFQRIIDNHFDQSHSGQNQVVINRRHRLVARALTQSTAVPLASVLRMLVINSLRSCGATMSAAAARHQSEDLDWIAECLWGKE